MARGYNNVQLPLLSRRLTGLETFQGGGTGLTLVSKVKDAVLRDSGITGCVRDSVASGWN